MGRAGPPRCRPRHWPTEHVAADLPVKQHEFTADGERGTLLRRMNARLQFGQPVAVAGRRCPETDGDVSGAAARRTVIPALRGSRRETSHLRPGRRRCPHACPCHAPPRSKRAACAQRPWRSSVGRPHNLPQGGQVLESEQMSLGTMRHLDRDLRHRERVEDADGTLDRDAKEVGERRREQIDRGDNVRVFAASGDDFLAGVPDGHMATGATA